MKTRQQWVDELVTVLVMVFAPKGIWGLVQGKTGIEFLPMRRRLKLKP